MSSPNILESPRQAEENNQLPLTHYPICHITYNRDSWVKLIELPSDYSADEAKLLCQESEEHWVAWVPDHGEVLLHRSNFYC